MSEILNGRREPSIETLGKLAAALGVPLWACFVTERQAALLADQASHDAIFDRRQAIAEEVRDLVAQALSPIAEKLTEAAVAKVAGAQADPAPAPPVVVAPTKRGRRRAS